MVVEDDDAVDIGEDLGEEIGRADEIEEVEVADLGEGEEVGGDRGVDGVGEEEDWGGGVGEVEVGGEGGEGAIGAGVVVEDRRGLEVVDERRHCW